MREKVCSKESKRMREKQGSMKTFIVGFSFSQHKGDERERVCLPRSKQEDEKQNGRNEGESLCLYCRYPLPFKESKRMNDRVAGDDVECSRG